MFIGVTPALLKKDHHGAHMLPDSSTRWGPQLSKCLLRLVGGSASKTLGLHRPTTSNKTGTITFPSIHKKDSCSPDVRAWTPVHLMSEYSVVNKWYSSCSLVVNGAQSCCYLQLRTAAYSFLLKQPSRERGESVIEYSVHSSKMIAVNTEPEA